MFCGSACGKAACRIIDAPHGECYIEADRGVYIMKRILSMALSVMFLLACCLLVPQRSAFADEVTTVALGDQKIFNKSNVTIVANELRYADGGSVSVDLTMQYTGGGSCFVYLSEMYVNNWLVPYEGDGTVTLVKGAEEKVTVKVDTSGTELFNIMQLHAVQTVKFLFSVLNENYYLQSKDYTKEIVNPDLPADFAQVYDDSGKVLRDDDTIRITQLAYDPAARFALLMVEKKQTSKWTSVVLDAMYNGCRAKYANSYQLDKGVRALVPFDAMYDCDEYKIKDLKRMDVYVLYYHSDRLQNPYMVTLVEEGAAQPPSHKEIPTFHAIPVYEDEYCQLYYAGAMSGYFTDADVIMLYCKNKTSDKMLSLFTAYEYILLDGKRVSASQSNVNVYPESVSQVALWAVDGDHFDLSGSKEAETTIGIYEIRGGYHELLTTTGKLKLQLHGIPDPLKGMET